MIFKKLPLLLALTAIPLFGTASLAGSPESAPAPPLPDVDPIFHHGALELQLMDGVEYSQQRTSLMRPNLDYELTVIRLGYMIDSPHRGGTFLRGNDEVILEAAAGPIYFGPGSALGGLCVLYRRNFLAPGARFVPYINAGAGGVYSDADKEKVQRALGSPFEFDLQGSLGFRFRLTSRVTLDAEADFRHLSNADLAPRNYGTNDIGGLIGVSYTF